MCSCIRLDNALLPRCYMFPLTIVNTVEKGNWLKCSMLLSDLVQIRQSSLGLSLFSGVSRVFATFNLNWLPSTFTCNQYNVAIWRPASTSLSPGKIISSSYQLVCSENIFNNINCFNCLLIIANLTESNIHCPHFCFGGTRLRSRLIQVAYVTSLGCLCWKPASFEIFWCKYVCMPVCISPHLPRFQVWPSKSRLFRSQSIDSERKTEEHSAHK